MDTIPTEELFEFNSDIFPELGNYKITKTGKIWSKYYNKLLDPNENNISNGYLQSRLNNKYYLIHRIVALNFIPISNNKKPNDLVVNHINENKLDNRIENLEWCTQKENCNSHNKKTSHSKIVIKMDLDGNELEIFDSITEAGESVNLTRHAISRVCNGKNQTAGGFKWKYSEIKEKIKNFNGAKVIKGYNNYLVFPNGIICDIAGNIIKPWGGNQINDNGYSITLCKKEDDEGYIEPPIENGKKKYKVNHNNLYIHRIVAEHFLNKPENVKASVIHINGDKLDNRVENLQYKMDMPTINNSFGIKDVKLKEVIKPEEPKKEPKRIAVSVDLSLGKKIKDFENYYVFPDGRVYSYDKKIFMKPLDDKRNNTLYVSLSKNKKYTRKSIHNLVAEYYLPNEDKTLKFVYHKNNDPKDNRVENLYWDKKVVGKKKYN